MMRSNWKMTMPTNPGKKVEAFQVPKNRPRSAAGAKC